MLYPLDEAKVEGLLKFIEAQQPVLQRIVEAGALPLEEDVVHRLAAERLLHVLTEAVTDVFAQIIDGLMLRDAGSYQDMVDIMMLEGALPEEYGERIGKLVAFRSRLVRDYQHVTVADLTEMVQLAGRLIPLFAGYIREFLRRELF